MTSSSTTVTTSPDELAYDLITYINKLVTGQDSETEFYAECKAMVDAGDFNKLVTKILESEAKIFGESSDTDAEGCFSIIASLIATISDAGKRKALIKQFTTIAASDKSKESAVLRLKIITNLYNLLGVEHKDRYDVFMVLVSYAAAAGRFNLLHGCLKNFNPAAWSLDLEETRAVYKLLGQVTQDADSTAIRATSQSYVIKLLSTYENDAKGNISEAKDVAARGVVGAIKTAVSSFTQNESLIEFAAVKQLKGDSKHGKLYDLLQVFSTGKVTDFVKFHKDNGKYLADQGIDHDEALENMRLLSMCSLAAEHEEIPYAVIAETLQVGDDEVEEWVVRTITSKLMEAKMDQLRKVVSINRCAQRVFGVDQWKQLGEKLTTWKSNVRAMLATIENAK